MTEPAERRPRLRIDPSDLALEMLSIVVAILLAFALNAWHDSWTRHAQERTALLAVREELRQNQADLVTWMPLHASVAAAYAALEKRGYRSRLLSVGDFWKTFSRTAAHGYNPFRGESTAWDLARSSDVLNDVALSTRITVEHAYAEQRTLGELHDRVVDDLHFRPESADPNFYYAAISMQIDTSDSCYSERRLRDDYRAALSALDATLR